MTNGETQLDRIEKTLKHINRHLADLNGKVARHDHTLYGPHQRTGLEKDVEILKSYKGRSSPGMISANTMWAAIASIAGVGAVIVALIVGLL